MARRYFQLLGLLVAVLSAVSLGLGVAHFISTYFLIYTPTAPPYCNSVLSSCRYAEQVVYAFIMPGVWGSAAAFATGVISIKAIGNMTAWRTVFSTLAFVTAVFFLPAMISVSIVNAVKVLTSPDGGTTAAIYNVNTGQPTSTAVLFAIPIVILGLGFLEFTVIAYLFIYSCICLRNNKGSVEPEPKPTQPVMPPIPAVADGVYPPASASYTPYGPLPYRRPYPINGDQLPGAALYYRPGLRTSYQYAPSRYPYAPAAGAGRALPLTYIPSYY